MQTPADAEARTVLGKNRTVSDASRKLSRAAWKLAAYRIEKVADPIIETAVVDYIDAAVRGDHQRKVAKGGKQEKPTSACHL